MNKRELVEKIENALEMVVAVCGRTFRILRDEDDRVIIAERDRKESEKQNPLPLFDPSILPHQRHGLLDQILGH